MQGLLEGAVECEILEGAHDAAASEECAPHVQGERMRKEVHQLESHGEAQEAARRDFRLPLSVLQQRLHAAEDSQSAPAELASNFEGGD